MADNIAEDLKAAQKFLAETEGPLTAGTADLKPTETSLVKEVDVPRQAVRGKRLSPMPGTSPHSRISRCPSSGPMTT